MAQAPTVALPKRLPLFIQPDNRDESTAKDAKLINGYMEKDPLTNEFHLYKRPGLAQSAATIAGAGLGVYNWLGDIYRIQGATIYKNDVEIAGGAPNGALNTAGGVYRFSQSLGDTPSLQFGNGAASYNYDGTTLTIIAGDNFPDPAVKGWAYLDGTTYVMDSMAKIHGCDDLNDPTAWTDVLNVIVAQIEPDLGVALAKQLVYAIAFKQWSAEVFYDALQPTASPLGPVQGAKVNFGCASADSVQDLDGDLFWLAVNRSSSPQVMVMSAVKASPVSSKPIERLLGNADFSSVMSFALSYEGHRFYFLTLPNNNLTLVYDAKENLWAQWTDVDGDYFPIVSATYITTTSGRLLQHATNGKLYLLDYSNYTDDGDVITVDLYNPLFDAGTDRGKMLSGMVFVGDQVKGSILQVRCNDNDYEAGSWSNFRYVDMSSQKPYLPDCGTFKRRAHHFRHQCNTPLRLSAVEIQMDICTL